MNKYNHWNYYGQHAGPSGYNQGYRYPPVYGYGGPPRWAGAQRPTFGPPLRNNRPWANPPPMYNRPRMLGYGAYSNAGCGNGPYGPFPDRMRLPAAPHNGWFPQSPYLGLTAPDRGMNATMNDGHRQNGFPTGNRCTECHTRRASHHLGEDYSPCEVCHGRQHYAADGLFEDHPQI